MTVCSTPDFVFPMTADVFYPIVEQGAYGNLSKTWVLDKTILCSFTAAGSAFKEEITPNVNITQDSVLVGRAKTDLRISENNNSYSITNVVISNISDKYGNSVYNETAGIRSGRSTIFEVSTIQPVIGPFGKIEYYNIVLKRSENQAGDV